MTNGYMKMQTPKKTVVLERESEAQATGIKDTENPADLEGMN